MKEIYFDHVAQIGNLYLDYVFYEFEFEPILFTCVDNAKNLYFCLCSDIRYGQRWLIMPCSTVALRGLIEEKIDIASAFLSSPQIIVVDMDLQGEEHSREIDYGQVDRLDLPQEGTYIRCDKRKARDYLWHKEWEALLQKFQKEEEADYSAKATVLQTYLFKICEIAEISFQNRTVFMRETCESSSDGSEKIKVDPSSAQFEYSICVNEKHTEIVDHVDVSSESYEDYVLAA